MNVQHANWWCRLSNSWKRQVGTLAVYCQDDIVFHDRIGTVHDDRTLEQSFRYEIEHVPTLIRLDRRQGNGPCFRLEPERMGTAHRP